MTKLRLSRRAFLSASAASVATPLFAGAPTRSLRPFLRGETRSLPNSETLVANAGLAGDTSYVLMDAQGTILRSRGAGRAAPPASVAKVITALYALDRLGKGYRFETKLYAIGEVVDGALRGDLVLVGGGDPLLNVDHLASLVGALEDAGITQVDGRFLVYSGALPYIPSIDPEQPAWLGYSPAISGLNLNYNRVLFEWEKLGETWSLAMEARGLTTSPRVGMSRMKIATRDSPVFDYTSQPGVDLWTVAKSALRNGGSRLLPVRFPELFAGDAFRGIARDRGISLPVVQTLPFEPDGTPIAVHQSLPLDEICREMLRLSTNVTAEVLGLVASGGDAPDLETSAFRMNLWAKERLNAEIEMADHSGLSGESRVTARGMANILAAAVDGPLADLLKPMRFAEARRVPGLVRAKTGTLNFVSGLGGYIDQEDARFIFTILSGDLDTRDQLPPNERERPKGGIPWLRKAKRLEIDLVELWAKELAKSGA